jgi:hypothetical protein
VYPSYPPLDLITVCRVRDSDRHVSFSFNLSCLFRYRDDMMQLAVLIALYHMFYAGFILQQGNLTTFVYEDSVDIALSVVLFLIVGIVLALFLYHLLVRPKSPSSIENAK